MRRRRLPAGRGRLPVPLPHRGSLRRRDGGLHPGVRHPAVRPGDGAGPHGQAAGGHLGRPDRQGHRGQDRRPAGPAHQPEHPGLRAAAWSPSQLPPQGVRFNQEDATVWDWTWGGTADQPIALGEPEDTHVWADYTAPNPGQRPQIMFDPSNGRYAWPLLQPHLGERPPFSPNGHSGAPWLGPNVTSTQTGRPVPAGRSAAHLQHHRHPDPHQRSDGQRARRQREPDRPAVDPNGEIFVLNQNMAAMRSGAMPAQPLAIRSDVGDCIAVTLTNDLSPSSAGVEATDLENVFREGQHPHPLRAVRPAGLRRRDHGLLLRAGRASHHRRDAGRDDADRGRAGRRDPDLGGQHRRAAPGHQHRGRPEPDGHRGHQPDHGDQRQHADAGQPAAERARVR